MNIHDLSSHDIRWICLPVHNKNNEQSLFYDLLFEALLQEIKSAGRKVSHPDRSKLKTSFRFFFVWLEIRYAVRKNLRINVS